jgi:hypothetical protein
MAAVIVMGVLIVAGVGVIVVTIVHRVANPVASAPVSAPPTAPSTILDEPSGTHIAATAAAPDRIALTLQGGGPDRVVVIDTRTGRVVARAGLAH